MADSTVRVSRVVESGGVGRVARRVVDILGRIVVAHILNRNGTLKNIYYRINDYMLERFIGTLLLSPHACFAFYLQVSEFVDKQTSTNRVYKDSGDRKVKKKYQSIDLLTD